MEQAQFQRGQDDQFKAIPEEEMETDQHTDEGQGHGKKSMLNKMKDKAKTLKTKVKKTITPHHGGSHEENHGGSQEDSQEASQEATSEEEEGDVEEHHQTGYKTDDVEKTSTGVDAFGTQQVRWDDSKSSEQHHIAEKYPDISSNKEEMPTEETLNLKKGVVNAEAPEPSLGLGKASPEGADRGKENIEELGIYQGTSSPENPGEEQFQSPEGKVNDNVKESPEKAELGKSWSERATGGLGFAKEKLQGYGVFTGTKSPKKPEEASNDKAKGTVIEGEYKENEDEGAQQQQSGAEGKADQSYVSRIYSAKDVISTKLGFGGQTKQEPNVIGETKSDDQIQGKEMDIDKKSPSYGEEIKTGPSETAKDTISSKLGFGGQTDQEPNVIGETKSDDQIQGYEMDIDKKSPSYGEQIKTGPPETAKDTISSKLGFGGQTNQEPNVMGETKHDDQIEGKEMDIDKKSPSYTEEIKTGPSETGSGNEKEASKLADELKKVLSFDQTSSNEKAKDTLVEGENKDNGDEGSEQQLSGGDGKAGQSYVSKIYSAKDVISSKLGYGGGQTNQEPNVIGESKPADQIQRTATEPVEGAKESKETFKSTIVSKLSPGEDDKALSEVITGAVSNSAKSLKDSLGGLYGGNGKVSTTDKNVGAPGIDNQSPATSPSGGKGIVGRVTGVVGSFFGSKQGDNSEQHAASEKSEPKSEVQVEEQVPEVPKY